LWDEEVEQTNSRKLERHEEHPDLGPRRKSCPLYPVVVNQDARVHQAHGNEYEPYPHGRTERVELDGINAGRLEVLF